MSCEICDRIARFTPDNPYLIEALGSGYAVLCDNQYYAGYSIFLSKTCVPELHDLPPDPRATFMREMSQVAEAVFRAFSPRKLNYELLGNSVTHLHWHLIPRYEGDPNARWPIWSDPGFLSSPRVTPVDASVLRERSHLVRSALSNIRKRA